MNLRVQPSSLRGTVEIPGSKSHTIRAVAIGALAHGESRVRTPLDSADARSSVSAYRALGAEIDDAVPEVWTIQGLGGCPCTPEDVIHVGNSGTSLNVCLGSASLLTSGMALFTGDAQIRRRPEQPLIDTLNALGARVRATRGNGCPPIVVEGALRGGEASLEAQNSQFVTSLLLNAPLAERRTVLHVPVLSEKPYVRMTLDWLARQGVSVAYSDDLSLFDIPGSQQFQPVDRRIPGDFSSATFFLAAGALMANDITCSGLDMADTQGDKAVVDYLRLMGAAVRVEGHAIRVSARELRGCEIDLNATPDTLPMMAVLGCFARGETRLVNVPQARIKETDRIAVMRTELARMGADIEELADGLVVRESRLCGTDVDGHDDHRVVMALAIAGTRADGQTTIHGYEAVAITFPAFVEYLDALGGTTRITD